MQGLRRVAIALVLVAQSALAAPQKDCPAGKIPLYANGKLFATVKGQPFTCIDNPCKGTEIVGAFRTPKQFCMAGPGDKCGPGRIPRMVIPYEVRCVDDDESVKPAAGEKLSPIVYNKCNTPKRPVFCEIAFRRLLKNEGCKTTAALRCSGGRCQTTSPNCLQLAWRQCEAGFRERSDAWLGYLCRVDPAAPGSNANAVPYSCARGTAAQCQAEAARAFATAGCKLKKSMPSSCAAAGVGQSCTLRLFNCAAPSAGNGCGPGVKPRPFHGGKLCVFW